MWNIITIVGGSGREAELMLALQMLLDKLNSGKIPISPEMINKSKSGTSQRQGAINVSELKVCFQIEAIFFR